MTELSSFVLFTGRIEQAVLFYRTVGLRLDDEDHGDGPVHYATEISGVHFALFDAEPASGRAPRGATRAARLPASTSPRSTIRLRP
jgi:hypothetical protein